MQKGLALLIREGEELDWGFAELEEQFVPCPHAFLKCPEMPGPGGKYESHPQLFQDTSAGEEVSVAGQNFM